MSTLFVTGATSGIGRAIAERFIKEGWKVIVSGRRFERLRELAKLCPERVHAIELDVRNQEAVYAAVANLPKDFADIDVLVNNAGISLGTKKAPECDIEDWNIVMDTNVKGTVYCTMAVLKGMVARNHGHIINISSIGAHYTYKCCTIYGATKAFISQFGRMLRSDLFGTKIRVSNLEPGIVKTEHILARTKGNVAASEAQYANCHPLTAEEMAECVYWMTNLPEHMDVTSMEVWPVTQNMTDLQILRENEKGEWVLGDLSIKKLVQ